MKVAFVNATHRWGGVKSWTLRVGRGLAARGHGVRLFVRAGSGHAGAYREAGLEVRELHFRFDFNPAAMLTLRAGFRDQRTSVVVTNVSKDNRVAGPAARALGLPVLQRVGGSGDLRDRWGVRLEQRRWVDRVVVPARSIRESLARFPWMRAEDRVAVIPNGVDLDRIRPGEDAGLLRAELGLDPRTPILAAAVQLAGIKGLDTLLRAVPAVRTPGPPPAVALLGRGKEEGPLRTLAAELGLGGRVRFLGFRPEPWRFLEDAAVVVHPSRASGEGLPNAVIETLAKGRPLVATAVGGVAEAVTDGEQGLLVPPGDPPALARALESLLASPDRAAALGAAGRRRAEAEFDERIMVERMEALLEGMVR